MPSSILRPPMGQMIETKRPFQRLYIDLIGPFPRTRSGHIGILIILDHFSKFSFLKPLKKLVSKPIISCLRDEIFMCYGVPEVIVSDNGTQFKSRDFEKLMGTFGIKHQFTAFYSPQSNASERVNRSINSALRAYVKEDHRLWDAYLPSVNCALRNTIHATTGETPYQIIFGQHMITHGKDFDIMRRLEILEESDTNMQRKDKFALLRDSIQSKLKSAYKKNERIYNLKSRIREFEVGQAVVRRNFTQSSNLKYYNAKLAPTGIEAQVIRKIGNVNYELKDMESGKVGIFHAKDIWT